MDDEFSIKINLDDSWFANLSANVNGTTQYDLFTAPVTNNMLQGAATITGAAGMYQVNSAGGGGGAGAMSAGLMGTAGGGGSGNYSFGGAGSGAYTVSSSNGTGGYNINADWNFGNLNQSLHVKGNAEFEGDIKIKGKSISDSLEKIEERLGILYPNEELESKWDELRELRKQYMEKEKEIIEKQKMWDILKK